MKKALLVFIMLMANIYGHAQSGANETCLDPSKCQIKNALSDFPELHIKVDGEWKSFPLMDEATDRFNYECAMAQLDGQGSKELIIRWSNAIYGSGGGSTTKGIQIWCLDKANRLFNEVVSCTEEQFGRNGNASYRTTCEKSIEIEDDVIRISKRSCSIEWGDVDETSSLASDCQLTTLEPGEYVFEASELIKK